MTALQTTAAITLSKNKKKKSNNPKVKGPSKKPTFTIKSRAAPPVAKRASTGQNEPPPNSGESKMPSELLIEDEEANPVDAVDLYRVFDTDMTTLFTIPHQLVSYTSGSDRYVRHDRTPNWLKKQIAEDENGGQPLRFYLCPAYAAAAAATAAATPTAKPQCASGRKCPHVHADVRCTTADDAPSAVVVETTHIHTKAQDMKDQTHARGTQIPIHDRGAGRVSEVASELVVRTKGSEDWFKTPSALRRRVYHCRHFSVEGVCLRGADCVFLHAVKLNPADDEHGVTDDDQSKVGSDADSSKHAIPNVVLTLVQKDSSDDVHSKCDTSVGYDTSIADIGGRMAQLGKVTTTTLRNPFCGASSLSSSVNSQASLVDDASPSTAASKQKNLIPVIHTYTNNPYEARVLVVE